MRDKERRLMKYEAEARVIAMLEGNPPMEVLSPFGPLIARATVPPDLVEHLNRYVDSATQPGTGAELLILP